MFAIVTGDLAWAALLRPGRGTDDDAFEDAVAKAGLGPVRDGRPAGRATVLSRQYQGGPELSGGQ